MIYTLIGKPIPLARPRKGPHGFYNSQHKQFNDARIQLIYQHHNRPLYTGPLYLKATFYFKPPRNKQPQHHTTRPDLSNLIKFIEDVAQGILFIDDCLIAACDTLKTYDLEARTEFSLTPLSQKKGTIP